MPRKKQSEDVQTTFEYGIHHLPNDAAWGGFINIRVSDEEKGQFELWWGEHRTGVWQAVDDLMGSGMKVSFAYDAENECYTCSLTGRGWPASKSRWCMTTRASTFDEVMALAMWKHFVLSDGDWGDYQPKTGRKVSWG